MMFAFLCFFVYLAGAVEPLDFNVTLDFDPLDPDFEHLSRIHIWSPPKEQSTETPTPTQQPTQRPTRKAIVVKRKVDDDTLLDQALKSKVGGARCIRIFILESRVYVPKFESQLIHQRTNDYVIVTKKKLNESNPLIFDYYTAEQFSLQKSSALILIIISDDWRDKPSLYASAIRQWMSKTIDEHKESEVLQMHFTDSLLTTIKSLPSRNMTANQLQIFRCLLKTFKRPIGSRVTRNDATDSLFADSFVMEFIKSFAMNLWTLTWNTLHKAVHELLTESSYALSGVIPDRDSLMMSIDDLFEQYHTTIHEMYGIIRFETNGFSLHDNYTVDDAVNAVSQLAKLDQKVMMLLDPLMIGQIVYDLYYNKPFRDISVVILSKLLISEMHRFLNLISNQTSIEYLTVTRRPAWQKGHAKGGFVGFNVNKMANVNKKQTNKKPKGKKKKRRL